MYNDDIVPNDEYDDRFPRGYGLHLAITLATLVSLLLLMMIPFVGWVVLWLLIVLGSWQLLQVVHEYLGT